MVEALPIARRDAEHLVNRIIGRSGNRVPLLTVEATKWLHDRKSKMHGVEGPSTDKPTDNIFAQHRLCRDLGISHWEWLINLEELLDQKEFQFFGVPLKFKGGSGSPVRAFAVLND